MEFCRHRIMVQFFFAHLMLQLLAGYGVLASSVTISFLMEPSDLELRLNANAMLPCEVSSLPGNHHIVWIHNGSPITEDGVAIGDASARYSTVGEGTRRNLAIRSVTVEDHGSYFSCHVYNGSLRGGRGAPTAVVVAESRSAIIRVLYGPPMQFPTCRSRPVKRAGQVDVVLSCCTQVTSVPLSLTWTAQEEAVKRNVTHVAGTGFETGQDCVDVNIYSGLNFTAYQCQLGDVQGKLKDFRSASCRVSKLSHIGISLTYIDHKSTQFNCTVQTQGIYQYLWHLQDEEKTTIRQVSSLSSQPSLALKRNKVSNGSYLSCSVFDKVSGNGMGVTDLKLVLSAPPGSDEPPTVMIIGIVIGLIVGILVCGLSVYFLLIKWKRRNDRLYASLERSSETGMQIGSGSAYVYLKNGASENMNGMVVGATAEGGVAEIPPEEIPPKPGGYRTISWEPEDMVIRSNGGVINHSGDPKRRNVEGLVYADLAFQQGDEERDEASDEASDDTLKGAVGGGDVDGSAKQETDRANIQYASIVPPPRSLRF